MIREKEFTKLQGIIGKEYALVSGEGEAVAQAIYEHYLPRFAGDRIPMTPEGSILSIADKIDTLVGFFLLGLIPTGSEDPYALRRQASGIVNIILAQKLPLHLSSLINQGLEGYQGIEGISKEKTKESLLDFFRGRMEAYLEEKGIRYDLAEATLSVGFDDLVLAEKRALALQRFKDSPDFERLVIGQKRAVNILRSVQTDTDKQKPLLERLDWLCSPKEELFQTEVERQLSRECKRVEEVVERLLPKGDYDEILRVLLTLRQPIDMFFDGVLVMTEEEELRLNRLGLMKEIAILFQKTADFSKVVLSGEPSPSGN